MPYTSAGIPVPSTTHCKSYPPVGSNPPRTSSTKNTTHSYPRISGNQRERRPLFCQVCKSFEECPRGVVQVLNGAASLEHFAHLVRDVSAVSRILQRLEE